MAFRAYGVADIIRTSHGVEQKIAGTVTENGGRARVVVDGVDFPRGRKIFPGKPTAAMLKANNLNVQTMKGRPWPGSAGDRFAHSPGAKVERVDRDGNAIRLSGPNSMSDAQRDGLWPDEEERRLQAIAEAKLHKPLEFAVRSLIAQGVDPAKAEGIAKQRLYGFSTIDVDDLLPARTGTGG